jgi:membrane-bound lytic murein transglycosylase MltF
MPIVSGEKVRLVVVTREEHAADCQDRRLEWPGNLCQSGQSFLQTPAGTQPKAEAGGQAEIIVKESDPNLTDEDLLEMTNAGIVPATVVFDYRAELWSVVLPDIIIHRDISLPNDATWLGDAQE